MNAFRTPGIHIPGTIPSFRRVVIVAPTRSTCVNIREVLGNPNIPPTFLMREKGEELANAVANLNEGGFGIVAGTGTGKTVALRDICQKVLGATLEIDVVTREHEATARTWRCNVLVVSPGVALNWVKSGQIGPEDLMAFDEIHQTSEHLELTMALCKRALCTCIFASATVDSESHDIDGKHVRGYREYLNARQVIRCEAFDPKRKARVECLNVDDIEEFLLERADSFVLRRRGVAVFVPTRKMAEELAERLNGVRGLHTEFYHGGESAEKLRPFLTGEIQRPFMVFMTSAGASSLNILGLNTVIIVDEYYTDVVRNGVKTLEKKQLDANLLLQMGGRVNGRAEDAEIIILTSRQIDFHELKPVMPQFVLGGDLERVALTCARLAIDARELDIIGDIDHVAYDRVVARFVRHDLIKANGELHLTDYGKEVERLPVIPAWGEMLVQAGKMHHPKLLQAVVLMACTSQLRSLTSHADWEREGMVVVGSDPLTSYNIVATALRRFCSLKWTETGMAYLLGGGFSGWCQRGGYNAKEITNILLAMKSVYGSLGLDMPQSWSFANISTNSAVHLAFLELLCKTQSFDFVRFGNHPRFGEVRSTDRAVASTAQTLGIIREWSSGGKRRASMEGTEIPNDLLMKHAKKKVQSMCMTPDGERVSLHCLITFAGVELEPVDLELPPDDVPQPHQAQLPKVFAAWVAEMMV